MELKTSEDFNQELGYKEISKIAEIFWELRYKIMNRFFATIGGIIVVTGWFYKEPELRMWIFIPLLLGSCFSLISHFLDKVNTYVLRECYRLASYTENKFLGMGGIFSSIKDIHYNKGSYYIILKYTYFGTAFIFFHIRNTVNFVVLL